MVKQSSKGDKQTCKGVAGPSLQTFKSNLFALTHLFQDIGPHLRVEHCNVMKLTPFYHLFMAFYEHKVVAKNIAKSNELTSQMINNYCTGKRAIMVGGRAVRIRPSDFQLIFGISSGNIPIKLKPTKKPDTLFVKRLCGNDNMITRPALRREMGVAVTGLGQEDVEIFVKMFCLFTLSTVFHSTSGIVIGFGFLEYVEELNNMLTYAWADFFTETLLESLDKSKGKKNTFVGCAALLQFWLCEHTELVKPVNLECVPRFLKWKLPKILKKAGGENYENIPKKKVKKSVLECTFKEAIVYRIIATMYSDYCVQNPTPNVFEYPMAVAENTAQISVLEEDMAYESCHDQDEQMVLNDEMDIVLYDNTNKGRSGCESECNHELLEKIRSLEGELEEEKNEVHHLKNELDNSKSRMAELEKELKEEHFKSEGLENEIRYLRDEVDRVSTRLEYMEEHAIDMVVWQEEIRKKEQVLMQKLDSTTPRLEGEDVEEENEVEIKPAPAGSECVVGGDALTHVECTREKNVDPALAKPHNTTVSVVNEKSENIEITVVRKYLNEADCDSLMAMYAAANHNLRESIWEAGNGIEMITFEDIWDVLYEGPISTTFMDISCSLIMEGLKDEKAGQNSILFSSMCFISLSKQQKEDIDYYIHEKVRQALREDRRLLIIPLSSDAAGNTTLHFTLLTFNTETGEWIFYNPMLPSGDIMGDLYADDAKTVVRCIDEFVIEFRANNPTSSSTQATKNTTFHSYLNTPQQAKGSKDCGIVVCYMVRRILHNQSIPKSWNSTKMRKERASLIQTLIHDDRVVKR